MDAEIEEKIKSYCKKISMKMETISIKFVDGQYIATDGYTSILFDKDGKVASFPIYKTYGNSITQTVGRGSAIFMYVIFAIVFLGVVMYNVIIN